MPIYVCFVPKKLHINYVPPTLEVRLLQMFRGGVAGDRQVEKHPRLFLAVSERAASLCSPKIIGVSKSTYSVCTVTLAACCFRFGYKRVSTLQLRSTRLRIGLPSPYAIAVIEHLAPYDN